MGFGKLLAIGLAGALLGLRAAPSVDCLTWTVIETVRDSPPTAEPPHEISRRYVTALDGHRIEVNDGQGHSSVGVLSRQTVVFIDPQAKTFWTLPLADFREQTDGICETAVKATAERKAIQGIEVQHFLFGCEGNWLDDPDIAAEIPKALTGISIKGDLWASVEPILAPHDGTMSSVYDLDHSGQLLKLHLQPALRGRLIVELSYDLMGTVTSQKLISFGRGTSNRSDFETPTGYKQVAPPKSPI